MSSLLSNIRGDLESGRVSREDTYSKLLQLYDFYEGQESEQEAVADVLDMFDGWSPLKSRILTPEQEQQLSDIMNLAAPQYLALDTDSPS